MFSKLPDLNWLLSGMAILEILRVASLSEPRSKQRCMQAVATFIVSRSDIFGDGVRWYSFWRDLKASRSSSEHSSGSRAEGI